MNAELKKTLRKQGLCKRRELTAAYREMADNRICSTLAALANIRDAQVISAYRSDGSEPDLSPLVTLLLEQKKTVCFPRTRAEAQSLTYEMVPVHSVARDFCVGSFGILEPVRELPTCSPENLHLLVWLVPGVAFHRDGYRLGRGRGIYDTLMAGHSGVRIGVFYACQEAVSLQPEAHDQHLNMIITEFEIIECTNSKKISDRSE